MASPVAESPAHNDIELPPAVHWPAVYAVAGIGGGLAAVLLAVALIAAAQTPPAPHPAETPAPVAVASPPAHHSPRIAKPAAPAEIPSEEAGPPVWKPLVPHPAPASVPGASTGHPVALGVPLEPSDPRPAAPGPILAPRSPGSLRQPIDLQYDDKLLADLQAHSHEVDLDAVGGTSGKLLSKSAGDSRTENLGSVVGVIARRPDLAGLPVRGESECRTSADAARGLQDVARLLHCFQPWPGLFPGGADAEALAERNRSFTEFLAKQKEWLREESVPALVQMLQIEGPAVRLQLTKMLASIRGRQAGAALARRALFDLAPELRAAAVEALKGRPADEYRPVLLEGFRHPWPPVAQHAAETLTGLDDRGAAERLAAMLDLPDPAGPVFGDKNQWVVPELVKVNHLRNCLLCHAPSSDPMDRVRGLIPKPGQELPARVYDDRRGGDFVRADITYLRQDFSLMERVSEPGPWPAMQRFDYMVRRRVLTDQEIIDLADVAPTPSGTYPQREAVLFALERLRTPVDRPVLSVGLGP